LTAAIDIEHDRGINISTLIHGIGLIEDAFKLYRVTLIRLLEGVRLRVAHYRQ
jgi:hypothetical protein